MSDLIKLQKEMKNNLRKQIMINSAILFIGVMVFFCFSDSALLGLKIVGLTFDKYVLQNWKTIILAFFDLLMVISSLVSIFTLRKKLSDPVYTEADEAKYQELLKKHYNQPNWSYSSTMLLVLFVIYNLVSALFYGAANTLSIINCLLLPMGYINALGLLPLLVLFCFSLPLDKAYYDLLKMSIGILKTQNVFITNEQINKVNLAQDNFQIFRTVAVATMLIVFLILGLTKYNNVFFYETRSPINSTQELVGKVSDGMSDTTSYTNDLSYSASQKTFKRFLQMKVVKCDDPVLFNDLASHISLQDLYSAAQIEINSSLRNNFDNTISKNNTYVISKELKEQYLNYLINNQGDCPSSMKKKSD